MKLHTFTRQAVSAVVAGAMALSLCAPALAAVPPLPGAPAAQLSEENDDTDYGTVGGVPEGKTAPSLNDLNGDPSAYQNKKLDYTDYGVTVKCGNDKPVKVNTLTMNALPGGLKYDPATNTLSSSGSVDGDLTIEGGAAAVNVDLQNPNIEYNTTAVNGKLTVTGAHNVSVAAAGGGGGSAYAVNGKVDITCSGDVKINGAVGGSFTVKGAQDVTLEGEGPVQDEFHTTGEVIVGGVNITCSGDVELTGYSDGYFIWGSAIIESSGTVHIENKNYHSAVSGTLTYTNKSAKETVLRYDDVFTQAVAANNGNYSGYNVNASEITIKPETKYTVTTNGCTLQDTTATAFYAGQTVRAAANAPAEGKQFERWNAVWTNSAGTDQPLTIEADGSFTMPAGKVSITAEYGSTPAPGPAHSAYTLDIGGLNSQVKITVDASGKHTIDGVDGEFDSVVITGTNTNAGFSVWVYVDNDQSANITLDGVKVDSTGDEEDILLIEGQATLTVEGTNSIKGGENAVWCMGDLTITGSGSLEATGKYTGVGAQGSATITGDVVIAATSTDSDLKDDEYYDCGLYGDHLTISQNANVKATGVNYGIYTGYGLTINGGTVKAAGGKKAIEVRCGGELLSITSGSVTADGEIYGNNGVSITGGNVRASSINSGNVIKEISGDAKVFLTSQTPSGWTTGGLNTDDSTGWLLWKDDTAEGGVGGVLDGKTAPSLDDLLTGDPSAYKKLTAPGEPSGGEDIPGDTVEDTSAADAAGAMVAGVVIGGAAVWGGYEIATRVILNQLLPEGASIPKNQGELALLLWNTAGRPEPAAEAPYADDTAKAAQWCVEQGWLDSTDTGRWTPKFRVIEVWNKAFPRQ